MNQRSTSSHTYFPKLGLAVFLFVTLCLTPRSHAKPPRTVHLENSGPAETMGWFKARIKAAKKGQKELVRIPVAHRGPWGCACPETYIGTDTATSGLAWLDLENLSSDTLPPPGQDGVVVIAEGLFTGEYDRPVYDSGHYEEPVYTFLIHRFRADYGRDRDRQLTVVASGDVVATWPKPLKDGKPYLLIGGSVPMAAKNARKRAEKILATIRKAWPNATLTDGRVFPRLFGASWLIVIERFADKKLAKEARKVAKKTGRRIKVKPYVRRGI